MFERFTDAARRVVVLAQSEARRLNHPYIGTEHVLLGLLTDPDGLARRALTSLGIDAVAVRQSILNVIGEGTEALASHIPFTPRAKKVLELALRESLQMGHNHLGSEHILLALIREEKGVAAQVLIHLGADLETMRATVGAVVESDQPSGLPKRRRPIEAESRFEAMLDRFTRRAQTVVATARDASRRLNHHYVGTEHLLLGLIADPEDISARALALHGVDETAVHTLVVEIVGEGVESPTAPVRIPFTPRARGVFEFSLRESLKLGRNYVDTDAILLALIRVGEGIATQVLTRLSVDLEGLRVTIMELIGIHPESGEPTSPTLWGARERTPETCQHLPANLSTEVHHIASDTSASLAPTRLIICTACGTTVGVLPA
jgi:ATP-dependent Clp protease ATP-binding subunit ClpA